MFNIFISPVTSSLFHISYFFTSLLTILLLDSFFRTIAEVVRAEEYDSMERVVDEEKTEKEEKRLLKANTFHYTPDTAKNLTPPPHLVIRSSAHFTGDH